ncbi:MAG: choice-of-anchor J domain-containing protein [Candidatus Cloacimonetes bacterium]|nr:choice-of-anchor J domain-containing protein [Candidatus Cloacimonadota bacterium]
MERKKIILVVFTLLFITSLTWAAYVEIGSGTSDTEYVPTYGWYDYSWSQVIYLQSEIGSAININKISYNVQNTPSSYTMPDQKIYMKHTSESVFPDASYDDPTTAGFTLVFDGSVIWDGAGWHDINLVTPFSYNGTDNLIIYWQNWDGDYSSSYPYFYYTSQINRVKYKYDDGSFPASAGYLTNRAANIRLHWPDVGPAISLSPTSHYFGAVEDDSSVSWDVTISNPGIEDLIISGVDVNAPFSCDYTGTIIPGADDIASIVFNPTSTRTEYSDVLLFHNNAASGDSTVALSGVSYPAGSFIEGFEGGVIPSNWTVINNDGGNNTWIPYNAGLNAHGGDYTVRVSYETPNDDWLITPELEVVSRNDNFSFWAKSGSSSYPEDFNVKLSTTGTAVVDFTETLGSVTGVPTEWTEYSYDLSGFNNETVFIAVQCVSDDELYLYLDDFLGPEIYYGVPATPSNPTPTNGATDQNYLGFLDWDDCQYATSYDVYLDTSPNPTTLIADDIAQSDCTYSGLLPLTIYYWKVVAQGPGGSSEVTWSFTTKAPSSELYSSDFEDNNGDLVHGGVGDEWEWGEPADDFINSAHSGLKCWATNLNEFHSSNADCYLESPLIDMTFAEVGTNLSFWHTYITREGLPIDPYYDGGRVEITTDGGANWEILGSYGYPYNDNNIAGIGELGWSGQQSWTEIIFSLDGYIGNVVKFRFRFISDGWGQEEGWAVDDVSILSPIAPDTPTNIQITQTGANIILNWDAVTGANLYHIYRSTNPYTDFNAIIILILELLPL